VIADERTRSSMAFGGKVNEKTGAMTYGFQQPAPMPCPNAPLSASQARPIEQTDAKHRARVRDYILIYDSSAAVADRGHRAIYYEKRGISSSSLKRRRVAWSLMPESRKSPKREQTAREKLKKTKWARPRSPVGDPSAFALVAADLVGIGGNAWRRWMASRWSSA